MHAELAREPKDTDVEAVAANAGLLRFVTIKAVTVQNDMLLYVSWNGGCCERLVGLFAVCEVGSFACWCSTSSCCEGLRCSLGLTRWALRLPTVQVEAVPMGGAIWFTHLHVSAARPPHLSCRL